MTSGLFGVVPGFAGSSATIPAANLSAAARVYFDIREKIVSLSLQPGRALTRGELAEQYGVSQSPIREAILRLEQDGLVVSYPQSKTVVTKIDESRLLEEHFLRKAVECDVVRRLAESAPGPDFLHEVNGLLKMQEALVGDLDQISHFKQLDTAFHRALYRGVGQLNLFDHVSSYCCHLSRVRGLDLPRREKMEAIFKGHKDVATNIAMGDAQGAAKAMEAHLSGTMSRLSEIKKEWSDLFLP